MPQNSTRVRSRRFYSRRLARQASGRIIAGFRFQGSGKSTMPTMMLVVLTVGVATTLTAPNILSPADTEALITVLEQAVIPDAILNWALDPKIDSLVVSTETVACALPLGADERQRQNAALEQTANTGEVPQSQLVRERRAGDRDLVVAPGRIVPRTMVARCLSSGRTPLPPMPVNSALRLEWESPSIVAREFRATDPGPWARRHPNAAGVVRLAKPVFSEDRSQAVVYFSRLKNGVGGAGIFCMLAYDGTWKVLWQETVWLE